MNHIITLILAPIVLSLYLTQKYNPDWILSGINIFWLWASLVKVKSLSHVQLSVTPWTIYIVHHAPPAMGFSRQEYCSGLPCPSPGDLSDSGIEPGSPALWVDTLPSEPPGKPVLPWQLSDKESPDPWVGKIPWRRTWQTTPVFLPGKSHGQRSPMDHNPWGCKRVRQDF